MLKKNLLFRIIGNGMQKNIFPNFPRFFSLMKKYGKNVAALCKPVRRSPWRLRLHHQAGGTRRQVHLK
jgi:hypothetical protein